VIRSVLDKVPALDNLLPHVKGNVSFIFFKDDAALIKKVLEDTKVSAAARVGLISPCDVILQPQTTTMDPSQTAFFQALAIPTRISKGAIEIINAVHLLRVGQKVGASESNLLMKLEMKPFRYGLLIRVVYDNGAIMDPKFLDITPEHVLARFKAGIATLSCASLGLHEPNKASVPHMLAHGYKRLLGLALGANFKIKQSEKLLAAAAAAPAPAAKVTAAPPAKASAPAAKVPDPVEEEEEVGVGGLFD
jgi:large subunit ribosomal protein LP0